MAQPADDKITIDLYAPVINNDTADTAYRIVEDDVVSQPVDVILGGAHHSVRCYLEPSNGTIDAIKINDDEEFSYDSSTGFIVTGDCTITIFVA